MSALAHLVTRENPMRRGEGVPPEQPSPRVEALQVALRGAGYRVGQDGEFGPRSDMVVRQFQRQHGLTPDGEVGPLTAALLDAPHAVLVETAKPLTAVNELAGGSLWPHDDTASLIAFYGDPRDDLDAWKRDNVVAVPCPWDLFYEGKRWPHPVPFHRKAAGALGRAFAAIWDAASQNNDSGLLRHVRHYSGSGELRAVRGSSRISTHGFWAAMDYDAAHLPLGRRIDEADMPPEVARAFERTGATWGNRFIGRPDPMHFQYAHE